MSHVLNSLSWGMTGFALGLVTPMLTQQRELPRGYTIGAVAVLLIGGAVVRNIARGLAADPPTPR